MSGKKSTLKLISLILAILMVSTFFTGCVGSNTSKGTDSEVKNTATDGPATSEKDKEVELIMWTVPYGTLKSDEKPGEYIQNDVVKSWQEKNPNIKIDVEIIPYEGINEKLTTAIASKTTPNILNDYGGRVLSYANMGAIEPLNDVLPKEEVEELKKRPDIMNMVAVGDDIMLMPYAVNCIFLMVNKSLWAAKNAEHLLPQDEYRTWTYDEFLEALRAVKDEEKGIYGIALYAMNEQGDQLYTNMLGGNGVTSMFSPDYSRCILAEKPEAEEVFQFFKTIVDEKLCFPNPESLSAATNGDYFKQGKSGMNVAGAAWVDIIKNGIKDGSVKEPFDYMFVNFPSKEKGKAAIKSEIGLGCVFKDTDQTKVEWAKKFLAWMFTENNKVYEAGKYMNRKGTVDWIKADKELEAYGRMANMVNEWPVLDLGWNIKGYSELRATMFPEMQSLFIGATTPKQTLQNITDKWNEIIKKYN